MVKVIEPIIEKAEQRGRKQGEEIGRKQGKKIGRKQGEEIGRKQGWANAQKEIARNFLKTGADSGMVASITGLSLEQVVKLQKEAIAE